MNSASASRATPVSPDPVYETVTPKNSAASPQLELSASTSKIQQLDEEIKNMTYVGLCTPHESNIINYVKNMAYEPSGFLNQ